MRSLENVLIPLILSLGRCDSDDNGVFHLWSDSNARLPVGDASQFVVYSPESIHSECIWLLGGNACGNCVYCYNLNDNIVSQYDTLPQDFVNWQKQNGFVVSDLVIKDDIFFFESQNILKYDIINKVLSYMADLDIDLENPFETQFLNNGCFVKHPENNKYSYIKYFFSIYLYDIELNSLKLIGNDDPYTSGIYYECVVNEYYNDPYWYVFTKTSGNFGDEISRVNLNNIIVDETDDNFGNIPWEKVAIKMDPTNVCNSYDDRDSIDFFFPSNSLVSYANYIYSIGGSYLENINEIPIPDIVFLDVKNWQVKHAGELLYSAGSAGAMYV